jgi:Protein of unknown function C-terminus (DUF2399)
MTALDPDQLREFTRLLFSSTSARASSQDLWHALAHVCPHRSPGPAERHLLLAALKSLELAGTIRFPPLGGKRWDHVIEPPVPTSITLVRANPPAPDSSWRTFPWHQHLHWVGQCRVLSTQQVSFLRRVHEGFVRGDFHERVPLKYRSLQLTGDEKLLASLSKTSLFGEPRLTLEMLGCLPDSLPIAWESLGHGGRMIIFENAGPFAVARGVLSQLSKRPYDLVAYGGGRSVIAAVDYINTIEQTVETIHYVGDLDYAGLDIAWSLRECAERRQLPVIPASELHAQMVSAAEAFGSPNGWPWEGRSIDLVHKPILEFLAADLRPRVGDILRVGRRIPEEVLGPDEMRRAWS